MARPSSGSVLSTKSALRRSTSGGPYHGGRLLQQPPSTLCHHLQQRGAADSKGDGDPRCRWPILGGGAGDPPQVLVHQHPKDYPAGPVPVPHVTDCPAEGEEPPPVSQHLLLQHGRGQGRGRLPGCRFIRHPEQSGQSGQ